ncbi:hypothetical protein IQ06DRAFT_143502 [Phaeosphaeriaceae sp. SRC1lsM3a]|nr:hypothetical protein IQ06DRAFT_143502 [Stagonospora sp. SRC1lsM3a]
MKLETRLTSNFLDVFVYCWMSHKHYSNPIFAVHVAHYLESINRSVVGLMEPSILSPRAVRTLSAIWRAVGHRYIPQPDFVPKLSSESPFCVVGGATALRKLVLSLRNLRIRINATFLPSRCGGHAAGGSGSVMIADHKSCLNRIIVFDEDWAEIF